MSTRPFQDLLADPKRVVREAWASGLRPDPILTVSQWADAHRVLSSVASASRGPWRTDRTPYLRDVMDALSPQSPYERVVFMKGTQIGATEAGNNWIGHTIDVSPGPMLYVLPTLDVARRVSKQRITPMIDVSPRLTAKVVAVRSRDSGNTTFSKEFEGGILVLTGANSPAGLRSLPIKNLFMDEVDAYPGDVGDEGDPVALADARTATFSRSKKYMCSSPSVEGLSRIKKAFVKTDQRRYFVPCPFCGHMDWLQWSSGGWYGKEGIHHHIVFENNDPSTARMRCSNSDCSADVPEHHKTKMLAAGEWRPTTVSSDAGTIGFHLSALYSPIGWESWTELVQLFLDSKTDPLQLKTFVNTRLGETWEESGASAEPDSVQARAYEYSAEVPAGVGILVAGVDVQGDRLEVKVKGYGAGFESWLIAFVQLWGDPGQDKVWYELDEFLRRKFTHESGRLVAIESTAIDSGFETDRVYRFCAARRGRRIYAVKGSSESGREIIGRPTMTNRYSTPVFPVGTDTAKEVIYGALRVAAAGPSFMHFPLWVKDDPEYAAQLTAETGIRKWMRGKGSIRVWVKKRDRNEALDCEVYSLAALHICGLSFIKTLGDRARALARPLANTPGPAAPPDPDAPASASPGSGPRAPRPRRGGWINSWKR